MAKRKSVVEVEELQNPISEVEAANYPKLDKGKNKDSLLGDSIEGCEGMYWHVKEDDKTKAGFWLSGAGVKVPKTIHIPTGSKQSYIKVNLTLIDGKKIEAWKIYKDV